MTDKLAAIGLSFNDSKAVRLGAGNVQRHTSLGVKGVCLPHRQ